MMTDPEERINRLLSLIPYVLKHQGVTLGELCEVFELSQEQLLKDLHLIFMCGQPDYTPADLIEVDIDDDRVYIRMADYFARPLRFTPAELSGLYLACSALSKLSGLPSSPALISAVEKIGKALGVAPISPHDIEESVEIQDLAPEHGVLAELSGALDQRQVVEMEYYTYGRDDLTRRRVHPLSLEFGMGHWYLRAWDERSHEMRVFRVDRIKDLEATEDIFEPPEGEEDSAPSPLGTADSGGTEVRLRFSPSLARWAREQRVFSEVEEEGDYLVCTLYADTLPWLERELLRYGPEVEILSPPELKERLRERVRNILSIYE
jgi:proteasome accessory factor C